MKKLHRYLAVLLAAIVAVGVYACGEKNTFQISKIEKQYTNVKITSTDDMGDIVLNEKRTQEFGKLFEGLVFEQTQSAGGLNERSYSVILLDGSVPVDSIQIAEAGTTVTYGGYFYRLTEGSFDTEKWRLLIEEEREEQKKNETSAKEDIQEGTEETQDPESAADPEENGQEEGEYYGIDRSDFAASKVIAVPAWPECRVDLDGDGSTETIVYEVQSADDIHKELLFLIYDHEGNFYSETEGTSPVWENPSSEGYFIMDLDSEDKYLEIAVLDDGPSGDPCFFTMRYDAGKLIYMGEIPTDSPYGELKAAGDGKVVGSGRLSILQTWRAPFTWVTEGNRIRLLEEEWYYPYVNSTTGAAVKQKKPVLLYEEPDLGAKAAEILPSDEAVTFGTTDNKNWVQFFRADGKEGWIYLEDGYYMQSGGERTSVMDIFENLSMAG